MREIASSVVKAGDYLLQGKSTINCFVCGHTNLIVKILEIGSMLQMVLVLGSYQPKKLSKIVSEFCKGVSETDWKKYI